MKKAYVSIEQFEKTYFPKEYERKKNLTEKERIIEEIISLQRKLDEIIALERREMEKWRKKENETNGI